MFTYVIVQDDDKIVYKMLWAVNCYNYSTWKFLDLWLYIQSGLSCTCNPAMN